MKHLDLDRITCLDPPGNGAGRGDVEVIAEIPLEHARACLERIGTAPLDDGRRELLRQAALAPRHRGCSAGCSSSAVSPVAPD